MKLLPLCVLLCALPAGAGCGPSGGGNDASSPGGGSGGHGGFSLIVGGGGPQQCSPPAEGGAGGDAAGCSSAGDAPDYQTSVAPILQHCAGEVCHDFSEPAGIRAFIDAPADECCNERLLIEPGHPARSYVIDKLEGRRLCYGQPMPLDKPPLSGEQLDTLRAWICAGAPLP